VSRLRDLDGVQPIYEVPAEDLAGELLIPAMSSAERVRIMAGFFRSESLAVLAPGLAGFLHNSIEPLELLISPKISDDDRDAIARAVADPTTVIQETASRLFDQARVSASRIAAHVLDCLAYLLARDRLRLKFVLMEHGLFHPKIWLFDDGDDTLAVHGSSNTTPAGLLYNGESVSVDRPWADGAAAAARVARFSSMFHEYWNNKRSYAIAVDPPAGLSLTSSDASDRVPTTADFWAAWFADAKAGLAPPLPAGVPAPLAAGPLLDPQRLRIPASLVYDTGQYQHQGAAVRAWEDNNRRGILAIATGGGKTISAFVAATRLQDADEVRPLLVLVLAPTAPLIDQWAEEAKRFSVNPYLLGDISAGERIGTLIGVVNGLKSDFARSEVLISSNQLFASSAPLRDWLRSLPADVRVLLIADEMHNLGTPGFLGDPPETVAYRIGLSATPLRQYDTAGSDALLEFFGPIVFSFGLDEAIAAGVLTPYHYHLHEVQLTDDEVDQWEQLTAQLSRYGFGLDDKGDTVLNERVQRLLERRRAILEYADGKLTVLEQLLRATTAESIARTLIYTSAKPTPAGRTRQITAVNRLLNDLGVISHQVTYDETGHTDRVRKILRDFAEGTYQALTAMKVLDEGLDVPATSSAYLLASSTVRREWVQRRGRVLRRSPGKTRAHLHDFLVVPPDRHSDAGRAILRAELARADEFARLAENEWDADGPRRVTERYT
jgi:superfamily II DNA or RNA helicase